MCSLIDQIKEMEKRYGKPKEMEREFAMDKSEFQNLLESMRDGRDSDITLVIFKDNKVVVIAKPWYPEGLYRLPSGGWKPGESFEQCAQREGYEETGTKFELQKYILRAKVTFTHEDKKVLWTSHVFTAKYLSGELKPIDTREIREVNLLTLDELSSLKQKLLERNSGGLAYRAALTEAILKEIQN
jgi:ADP-ribose pyrophosphatase YjhB (NUDIX family)